MVDQYNEERIRQTSLPSFRRKNRRLIERFTEEKQRFNARGLLYSSETVKAMHKVLETEISESMAAVVATAIDVIGKNDSLVAEKKLQDFCSEALSKRKDEIEALFLSDVRHVEQGLQNKAMLQPYMSLGDFYTLQREEMVIKVSGAYKQYMQDRGGNLTSVIKNRFLNLPIVAWAAIVIAVILLFAAFAGAIDKLRSLFG